MKKIALSLILFFVSYFVFSQCSNPFAGEDTVVCGYSVELNVQNATTGYWTAIYEGTPMSPVPIYTPGSMSPTTSATIVYYNPELYKDVVFVWTDDSGPCTDSVTVRFAKKPIASVGCCNQIDICGVEFPTDQCGRADTTGSGWATWHWFSPEADGYFIDSSNLQFNFILDEEEYGEDNRADLNFQWIANNNGCVAIDTMHVDFYSKPNANAGLDQEVCGNTAIIGAVFDLQESPNYSPEGWWEFAEGSVQGANANFVDNETDSTFVAVTEFGDYQFVFREKNAYYGDCFTTDTVQITFQENNEILPVLPLIIDDEPITLTALSEGGIWSGNGIIDTENGVFDPTVAGIGMHTISYFIEDFAGCNGYTETGIRVTGVNLEGYLYNDVNENCIYDAGEGVPNTLVYANPGPYYALTNDEGQYKMYLDEGAYTLHSNQSELYFVSCPELGFQNVEIVNINDTVQDVNIGLSHTVECPMLHTEIYSSSFRPGFMSVIFVGAYNFGTVPAENVYLEVELDDVLTLTNSDYPYSSIDGNTYTIELNTLDVLTGEYFFIYVDVDNDIELLGQTCCVTSRIYPTDPCNSDFGDWDYSDIGLTGECIDDLNACFNVYNLAESGIGDMLSTREYRIFANDTLVFSGTYQLNGGDNTDICWATNGSAIRLEVDQHPEHPFSSFQENTVEACGDVNGTSYGYIATTPYDDESDYIDIACRVITGSYDPNDKIVHPSGVTDNNYFEGNRELTYQINFQNTGTDTAFTVVVVDTISAEHDILTFERGASSHPCELEVYDEGILVWTFNNILLPDSTTNEIESHGFVTYTIMPVEMSAEDYGTEITNNAAIYFDNNPPIITDATRLTYWNLPLIYTDIFSGSDMKLSLDIFPNPTSQTFSISTENNKSDVKIFDMNGKLEKTVSDYSGEQIDVSDICKGLYFVKLSNENGISVGKLILE